MHIITTYVLPDERCHGMAEGPLMMPTLNGKGMEPRWVQRIFVIRDDAIAKYMWNIGPVEDYEDRITPMMMPSFGENTVAELQAHFEKNRHETKYMRRREEMAADSTLVEDAIAIVEQRYLQKSNKTLVAPSGMIQRGEWSQTAAERVLRDRVKERKNGH